jgi:hypothetical protein
VGAPAGTMSARAGQGSDYWRQAWLQDTLALGIGTSLADLPEGVVYGWSLTSGEK